jgi:hypothetical protein
VVRASRHHRFTDSETSLCVLQPSATVADSLKSRRGSCRLLNAGQTWLRAASREAEIQLAATLTMIRDSPRAFGAVRELNGENLELA